MDYGERRNIFIDFPMHCCLYCMFMYKHSLKILVHKNMHAGMHDHACIFTHTVCECMFVYAHILEKEISWGTEEGKRKQNR